MPVLLNPSLYNWTIENLVKNGIDAMKGKGNISIEIDSGRETCKCAWFRIPDTAFQKAILMLFSIQGSPQKKEAGAWDFHLLKESLKNTIKEKLKY